MAGTVRGVVEGLEAFTGKKISGTSQPNITLEDFKDIIMDALELADVRAHDIKLPRTGVPRRRWSTRDTCPSGTWRRTRRHSKW